MSTRKQPDSLDGTQSAAARESAEAEVSALVARFAPANEPLVATARRWLQARLPTAHEVVYEYRDAFVISYSPDGRGYEAALALHGSAKGVLLYFNRGKDLPDPGKLLKGSGHQTRSIQLEAATLARPDVSSPRRRRHRRQSRAVRAHRARNGGHPCDLRKQTSPRPIRGIAMSVKIEASGRRSVEDEFEVAGTPDEVWQAIATGPGISAWFVPTQVEQRDGKAVAVKYDFGPGMEPRSDVTVWDPPRTLRQEADGWFPGSPRMASEWTIESRAGGTCTLRIVHSLFASTDDWDDQLEGAKSGWSGFLATLRVYLAHFRGQHAALAQLRQPASGSDAEIWDALTSALGLGAARVGERFAAPAGAPAFSGVVEHVSADPYDALLRIDAPAPGIVALGIAGVPGGGQSKVGMNLYLYGDSADAALAREAPRWEAWLRDAFATEAQVDERR